MTTEQVKMIDEILDGYRGVIGGEFDGYRNHVCRMVNFCLELDAFSVEETEKLSIAGCFHDIGIWTAGTFDYLAPSIVAANEYLEKNGLSAWSREIAIMIDDHHKLRHIPNGQGRLPDIFRKGDLVDFSLGLVKHGIQPSTVASVKKRFPNAGFHLGLAKLAGRWICRHPLNPIPVLKW